MLPSVVSTFTISICSGIQGKNLIQCTGNFTPFRLSDELRVKYCVSHSGELAIRTHERNTDLSLRAINVSEDNYKIYTLKSFIYFKWLRLKITTRKMKQVKTVKKLNII